MNSKNNKFDKILNVTPKVDFKKFKETLGRLKKHKNVALRSLDTVDSTVKEDYMFVADNISLLHNTKHAKTIHDHITDIFGDVDEYVPNTIGSYLNGCNQKTNLDMPIGCTPICAGSVLPLSESLSNSSISSTKSNGNSHVCSHTVMHADWDGKRFVFTDMNDVAPRDSILMFTSFAKVSEFPGFSPSEKTHLKNYGIRRINLIYYSRDGTNYKELFGGSVKIDEFPEREASSSSIVPSSNSASSHATGSSSSHHSSQGSHTSNGNNPDNPSDSSSSSGAWWIWLIVIIIILIILWILWRRNNTYYEVDVY